MRVAVRAVLAAVGVALMIPIVGPTRATAVTGGSFVQPPPPGPVLVPNRPSDQPPGPFPQDIGSFTIQYAGFPTNTLVSAEQCDGNPPTAPGYAPDTDCDVTSEPAQVKSDGSGGGTFPAYDVNFGFYAFRGDSPQSQFTCLSPNEPVPSGTVDPVWRNCQLKLTTNDSMVNPNDAYMTMTLAEPDTGGTTTTTGATTTTTGATTTTTTGGTTTTTHPTTTTTTAGTTTTTTGGTTTTTGATTTTTTGGTTTTTGATTTTTTGGTTTTTGATTTTTTGGTTTTTHPATTTTTAAPTTTTTVATTSTTTGTTTSTTKGPSIVLGSTSVAAGGATALSGSGFPASTSLQIQLESTPVTIGTVMTGSTGSFQTTITIPAATAAGSHTLVVATAGGAQQASAALTVTASTTTRGTTTTTSAPAQLGVTGTNARRSIALGLAFVGLGLLLLAMAWPEERHRYRSRPLP